MEDGITAVSASSSFSFPFWGNVQLFAEDVGAWRPWADHAGAAIRHEQGRTEGWPDGHRLRSSAYPIEDEGGWRERNSGGGGAVGTCLCRRSSFQRCMLGDNKNIGQPWSRAKEE